MPEQIIQTTPTTLAVDSGDSVEFEVIYSTNNPVDETLAGLGLRLHYDSTDLQFNTLADPFPNDLTPFGNVQQSDDQDFDNDPTTDSFVLLAWADVDLAWPGDGTSPLTLYTATFTAIANQGTTTVNFTAASTAPSYELNASSLTIQIDEGPPTEGPDLIIGTPQRDILRGLGGNDRIFGRGGNDVLRGDEGNDRIFGESGNDRIFGGTGNDTLNGGIGNDRIKGEDGRDLLKGKRGNDVLIGGNDNDRLIGDDGDDRLIGDDGRDVLRGGDGQDRLKGGDGNDKLFGQDDNDVLIGQGGNDRIIGGDGNDRINAGSGNDTMLVKAGRDRIRTGTGRDVVSINQDGFAVILDFQDGRDKLKLIGSLRRVDFEDLDIISRSNFTLIRHDGNRIAKLQGFDADDLSAADFA